MKSLRFLFSIVFLLSVTVLFAQEQKQGSATGAMRVPDHLTLTWTADPHTTQTITWRASADVQTGVVQYQKGAAVTAAAKTAKATRQDFVTELGGVALFSAALTGLEPGATYAYRVGDGTSWSALSSFGTEPKTVSGFKFLIFGDSQSGIADNPEYKPWHDTVQGAFAANKDARFVVNMGDLVETGLNYSHWNAWFAAAKGVIDMIPDMAVQGNHETYADGVVGSVKPAYWAVQFPLPQNGPAGLENQVYSWDYGNVHFAVLDSQEDEEAPTYGDILQSQVHWLTQDLAATRQPWKIVFFHKTPYYLKASRTNEAVKAAFTPVLDAYHVDLVFNGHDHGVARTYAMKGDEFVSRPSQGTIYYVTGRSGNKAYPDLSQKVWDAFFFDPQDQPNYLVAEVKGTTLTVRTVKQDGTVVDTFAIDKASDMDTDARMAPAPSTAWVKYATPTLAIFGNVVSPTMSGHIPMKKDDVWYVDLKGFAGYVGAAMSMKDAGATLSFGGKDYALAPAVLLTDNKATLVSADALQALGFSAAFHPATNLLEITR